MALRDGLIRPRSLCLGALDLGLQGVEPLAQWVLLTGDIELAASELGVAVQVCLGQEVVRRPLLRALLRGAAERLDLTLRIA